MILVIPQVIEIGGPDRLPGEVMLEGYDDTDNDPYYDPEPTIYDINLNYDKLNDPEEVKTLFDPYEEMDKEEEDDIEDTMIIPNDVIMEANRQGPESFYEHDESYDTIDSYYATHNRKRRHKSIQHYVKKTTSNSEAEGSKQISSSTLGSTHSSYSRKERDKKHKAIHRLDDYFGGLAVT